MNLPTHSEISKIQKFGRYAQAACIPLLAILAIGGPLTVLYAPPGPGWTGWAAVYAAVRGIGSLVAFVMVFMAIAYLYALFGALSKGEIYTQPNVRRIRRLGELALALGALQIAMPVVSLALLNAGIYPPSAVSVVAIELDPSSLTALLAGGLILLVSWIMEVGRRTSEDAEHLRRDAELVV